MTQHAAADGEPAPFCPIFNGFVLVEAHLRERAAIEAYIHDHHLDYTLREDVCHPACLFGQWLHGAELKTEEDLPLFNQLCAACSDFHANASEAVSMKQIGNVQAARAMLQPGSRYACASAGFQHNVFILHDKLHEQYRQGQEDW